MGCTVECFNRAIALCANNYSLIQYLDSYATTLYYHAYIESESLHPLIKITRGSQILSLDAKFNLSSINTTGASHGNQHQTF